MRFISPSYNNLKLRVASGTIKIFTHQKVLFTHYIAIYDSKKQPLAPFPQPSVSEIQVASSQVQITHNGKECAERRDDYSYQNNPAIKQQQHIFIL